MILNLNYKKNKKIVLSMKIFPNVCKNVLLINGYLKFTFKKVKRKKNI